MKVFAYVLSVILATGLLLGGTVLIILEAPSHSSGLLFLAIGALTVFIYGPLVLGSITSYWNVRNSLESRRYFRWWFGIILGLEVLGAVAIVIYAALTQAPAWVPVVFIGGACALAAIALLGGRLLFRHDEAHRPVEGPWAPISRREILRKIAIVVITFVVTFVVVLVIGIILFTVLVNGSTHAISEIGVWLSFAAEFAFLAAAMACILVSLPLNRRLRESVGRDLGRLRKVAKVVLRGKRLELDHDEQIAAAKYAVLISITFPFQLAYISLLYVGLGLQQVQSLVSGNGSAFSIGLIVALIVVLVVFFPSYGRRIYRARKYARDHADLLPADDETSAPAAHGSETP